MARGRSQQIAEAVLMLYRNTFGIPDIPSEPCLILCPHSTFLALAFADRAFKAPDLTMKNIFELEVQEGRELPLIWDEGWLKRPIFRRSERTAQGIRISESEPWTPGMLNKSLKSVGIATGIDLPIGAYTFRRGNGEALENSGKDLKLNYRSL